MKHAMQLALAALALVGLSPTPARAQADITPADVLNLGTYHIESFSISPADGAIAFNVGTFDPNTGLVNLNVWTMFRGGGSTRRITTFPDETVGLALDPSWNAVLFLAYRVQHQVPPPGSTIVPGPELAVANNNATNTITPAGLHVDGFSWSADPGMLALLAHDDAGGPTGIYTMNVTAGLAGSGLTRRFDCPSCDNVQFSALPDQLIAYDRGGDIFVVNANGTNAHLAIENGHHPVWSPATGMIAFTCGTNVCVANIDGTGRRQVTHNELGLSFRDPAWSPDETRIAVIGRPPLITTGPGVLFVATQDGSSVDQKSNDDDASAPQWLPVLFDNDPPGPAPLELYYLCDRTFGEHICVLEDFGVPQPGCDPTICPGCCSQGACLRGGVRTACGVNGAECESCLAGQVCGATGSCVNPVQCDIGICASGCCDSQNVCRPGDDPDLCGSGALPCQVCASGQICDPMIGCVNQNCLATCTGCCGANGCQPGTSDDECGGGGLPCVQCTGIDRCATNRTCQPVGCDISTCRSGCCDANGGCHDSGEAAFCGKAGAGCQDCSATGCDQNTGLCLTGTSTGCASCQISGQGCCNDVLNRCEGGHLPTMCGGFGAVCQNCNNFPGYTCQQTTLGNSECLLDTTP